MISEKNRNGDGGANRARGEIGKGSFIEVFLFSFLHCHFHSKIQRERRVKKWPKNNPTINHRLRFFKAFTRACDEDDRGCWCSFVRPWICRKMVGRIELDCSIIFQCLEVDPTKKKKNVKLGNQCWLGYFVMAQIHRYCPLWTYPDPPLPDIILFGLIQIHRQPILSSLSLPRSIANRYYPLWAYPDPPLADIVFFGLT